MVRVGLSDISEDHLDLRSHLPPQGTMVARLPGAESVPTPEYSKVVVFFEHFVHGFGLPASTFFRRFLTRFGLQPHHLGANSILQLFAFVALCKGYLGIEPRLDLWCCLFYLKKQTVEDKVRGTKEMTTCGAALVYNQLGAGFPKLPLQKSVKNCERSFFYVKNVDPTLYFINLPLPQPVVDYTTALGGRESVAGHRGGELVGVNAMEDSPEARSQTRHTGPEPAPKGSAAAERAQGKPEAGPRPTLKQAVRTQLDGGRVRGGKKVRIAPSGPAPLCAIPMTVG
ncbi:hypothetical protein D1007_06535 [Hordeum vulgare]|nr:hypothetical protein D1007_06535 [Hordeum vulgare]